MRRSWRRKSRIHLSSSAAKKRNLILSFLRRQRRKRSSFGLKKKKALVLEHKAWILLTMQPLLQMRN